MDAVVIVYVLLIWFTLSIVLAAFWAAFSFLTRDLHDD